MFIPVSLRDDARLINFGRYRECSHVGEMCIRHSLMTTEEWKKYSVVIPESEIQEVQLTIKNDRPCSLDAVKMQSCFELAASIPAEFRHLYPAPDPELPRKEKRAISAENASKKASRTLQKIQMRFPSVL